MAQKYGFDVDFYGIIGKDLFGKMIYQEYVYLINIHMIILEKEMH